VNETSAPVPPSPDDEAIHQSAVLWLLIDAAPDPVPVAEILTQLIATPPGTAAERAQVSQAIAALVAIGLVELEGQRATATRPALRASQLLL
jgi:hypothetical protein